jgi:hypothetical protein
VSAPLYVRDGSRFVVYSPEAQHTPPIRRLPVPDHAPDERPNYTAVEVSRCAHGSFMRYAIRNCCPRR